MEDPKTPTMDGGTATTAMDGIQAITPIMIITDPDTKIVIKIPTVAVDPGSDSAAVNDLKKMKLQKRILIQ